MQGLLDAGVDDAHLGGGVLHVVVDELGVVLRADARQVAALGLGGYLGAQKVFLMSPGTDSQSCFWSVLGLT